MNEKGSEANQLDLDNEVLRYWRKFVSSEVVVAVDRVVLRGHPIGEGAAVFTEDGTRIEIWPEHVHIGPVTLYLKRVYAKNGAQEAQYERRH